MHHADGVFTAVRDGEGAGRYAPFNQVTPLTSPPLTLLVAKHAVQRVAVDGSFVGGADAIPQRQILKRVVVVVAEFNGEPIVSQRVVKLTAIEECIAPYPHLIWYGAIAVYLFAFGEAACKEQERQHPRKP